MYICELNRPPTDSSTAKRYVQVLFNYINIFSVTFDNKTLQIVIGIAATHIFACIKDNET